MPLISAPLIDRSDRNFRPDRGHLIAIPVSEGRRGKSRAVVAPLLQELMTLDGDIAPVI